MQLYKIAEKYQKAFEAIEVDENTGEIIGGELLDSLEGDLREKMEAIALYIKDLNGDAEKIAREEKALYERRKRKESRANWFSRYLAKNMENTGINELETERVQIGFRSSKAVHITDNDLIPPEYMRVKTEPNKTMIGLAIKNGIAVPGAEMTENRNLKIK